MDSGILDLDICAHFKRLPHNEAIYFIKLVELIKLT